MRLGTLMSYIKITSIEITAAPTILFFLISYTGKGYFIVSVSHNGNMMTLFMMSLFLLCGYNQMQVVAVLC